MDDIAIFAKPHKARGLLIAEYDDSKKALTIFDNEQVVARNKYDYTSFSIDPTSKIIVYFCDDVIFLPSEN